MLPIETHRRHLPDNVPAGVCPVQSGLLEHLPLPGRRGGVRGGTAVAVLPDDGGTGGSSSHIYYEIIEGKSNMSNYVVITFVELRIVRGDGGKSISEIHFEVVCTKI